MKKLKVLNLSKGEQFKITGGAGSCTGPGTCRESNCTCTGWLVSNHAWTETDARTFILGKVTLELSLM